MIRTTGRGRREDAAGCVVWGHWGQTERHRRNTSGNRRQQTSGGRIWRSATTPLVSLSFQAGRRRFESGRRSVYRL